MLFLSYNSCMSRFHLHIGQGLKTRDHELDLPNAEAAWTEATGLFGDLTRDIVGDLKANPEWHMTVSDASGKVLFKVQLAAEIYD